jgi:hypothetical protein
VQKSDAQKEKERKRKEHAAKILQKHGGGVGAGGGSGSGGGGAGGERKKQRTSDKPEDNVSAFQALFKQRAQGFEIAFKFRNAPPRPPVGPSFIGTDLDEKLREISQYKPLNAVEVNYRWKLHSEPDLGVPLAPSAMDPMSYTSASTEEVPLHPDDLSLLEWKGSMGDTAAEELKRSRDYARAAARLALMGKSPSKFLQKSKTPVAANAASTKKTFSRVLDEAMQSWMKKTTYMSNDYTRKVHDFKSLAKTKQEVAEDLEVRQEQIAKRRHAPAVAKTFEECKQPVRTHPSKKDVIPVAEMAFLPNVKHWGQAYTHVVVDKSPGEDVELLDKAFVANVEKRDANARMTCQLFVPSSETEYNGVQQYDLDVVPLKEEDTPHANFCIWVDERTGVATYFPIASRVQLSIGRPLDKRNFMLNVTRRTMNATDMREMEDRVAEVDIDVEERIGGGGGGGTLLGGTSAFTKTTRSSTATTMDEDDDSDDSSDHGGSFMQRSRTIVAED